MFTDNFFHDTMTKYMTYFGAMFSNVFLDRTLTDGELAARFKVPLHYASVDRALDRIADDPHDSNPEAIVLPAMAFNLVDLKYNGERHTQTMNRFSVSDTDPNLFGVLHAPSPWDFHFQLAIMVKNQKDAFRILESIVPYFTPDYTAHLELVPEMGLSFDTPVVLENMAMDYDVPADYKTRVTYIWVLDFTLQGYLFGPEKKWPVIKFASVDIGVATGNGNIATSVRLSSQPGLDANNNPTDSLADTIPYTEISVTSNYDYVNTTNNTFGVF